MRIRLSNAQTLDELSITLQKILAYMADNGVESVDRCNLYLTAFKPSGAERIIPASKLDDFEIMKDQPKGGGSSRQYGKSYRKK